MAVTLRAPSTRFPCRGVASGRGEPHWELVDGADAQFQELRSKNAETERKEISALAHGLRGCLLNFGFTEVGGLLMEVENGTYPASEYLGRIDQAQVVFITSKNLLAARYPSLGLA